MDGTWPGGHGEMAALMREKDWASTALGPVESWSPALRTLTSILLANRFPMLLWWGPDSISIYNDAYIPVLGVKHPAALGEPVREVWSEIYDVLRPMIQTPLEGGPATWSDDLLLEIRRHDFLEETHWTVAYSPVPDETAPNGIGGVLATVYEVTAQVVGRRRNSLLRDLGSSEARTAEDACANAAAVFARYPSDVPFAQIYLLDRDAPRLVASAGDARPISIVEAMRTETPQVDDFAMVLPLRSNRAHHLAGVLVAGVSPRLQLDASYRGFLELAAERVATAISSAREYDDERRRAEGLAELDRAKTSFFSNVSHEFRTPLTLLLGPLEEALADRDDPLSPGQRQRHETAHRNALRLLKLVNSLLDFSRIEAGRTQAAYEPTDLAQLTYDIASAFRSLIERAGVRLVLDCAPVEAYVDRGMWEQIVLNLVSNAYKFTFAGEIAVRLESTADEIRLTVRDTGVGIDAVHLPRIFERFYRVDGAQGRTYEGTGIGLSLVRELAQLHGGAVVVESAQGRGTTLAVTIPTGFRHLPEDRIQPARPAPASARTASLFLEQAAGWGDESGGHDVPVIEPSGDTARLLVAEDNADMRAYLVRLLRPLGTVRAVGDGREALDAIERELPDLLVTDVMLPNLDGIELVRTLRDRPPTKALPIVLLSARAGEDPRIAGSDLGVHDYIVKPFSARELVARVRSQLELARQRAEHAAALAEVDERFRALVTATSDVVYRMSADWTEMRQLVGRDFIKDTTDPSRLWLESYIPVEDRPRVTAAIRAAITSRTTFELEHRVLRVDGSIGWTFSRAIPLVDAGGTLVEWFGAASDITTRKYAEEALRASEERYRTLFDSIDEGFCVIEMIYDDAGRPSDYRFLEVNPAFEKHTGLVDALGKRVLELVPGQEQRWFDTYGEIARTGEPKRFEGLGSGMGRWFDVYAFRLGPPEAHRVAALFTDITQRKATEQALLDADRRKDEFLAVLSHELRNPLAPIANGLYILDHAPPDSDRAVRAKQIIARQVAHLSSLVNDLLDVTRIVSGKVQLQKERIDVNEIVQRAVEDSRSLFESGAVQLDYEPAARPVYVQADRTRAAQIVGNLLNNSAKFTQAGGRTHVSVSVEHGEAVIRVTDDGIGIAPEMLQRLFEPFAQAEQTLERSKGGLGLGLALVRGLTELHGGSASAHSEGLGRGTELVVRLPLDGAASLAAPTPPHGGAPAPRRRILIIEDNPDAADTLSEILAMRDNHVEVAYDGPAGIEKARALRPDIVLCDIGLPGMDGYDVARAVRADAALAGTVLVALSGYARPEDLARASDAGFDRHLAKPVAVDKLVAILTEVS